MKLDCVCFSGRMALALLSEDVDEGRFGFIVPCPYQCCLQFPDIMTVHGTHIDKAKPLPYCSRDKCSLHDPLDPLTGCPG